MYAVHHLNCCTMRPLGRPRTRGGRVVCHCLLLESADRLCLVDTGVGLDDVRDPVGRLGRAFRHLGRPVLEEEETALRQVEALGHDPGDVEDVVVTHLDLDHAGGLPDLPGARVHVLAKEHEAATRRRSLKAWSRYVPAHWAHGPRWVLHEPDGETWFGLETAGTDDLPEGIRLVPLPGHTLGHCGVAVRTGDGWLLHAGDAYMALREMDPDDPRAPRGLALFHRSVSTDWEADVASRERLRGLVRDHGDEVTVFCSHDPRELDRLRAGRPLRDAGPRKETAP